MIKRAAVLALCVVMAVSLCSCYDYKELKNYTFVMGIGVDLEDGRYKVTAELGCISDGGDEVRQAQKSSVIERSADSFPLALSLLTDTTGGELYFKNCAVAVLGEELCENGIGDVVEYLVKSPDFQKGMTLATAVGKAESVFSIEPTADGIISTELSRSISSGEQGLSNSISVPPYRVQSKLQSGGHIALTRLRAVGGGKTTVEAGGLGIIKDGRQVCTLSHEDAVYYMMMRSLAKKAVIEYENGSLQLQKCYAKQENGEFKLTLIAAGKRENIPKNAGNELKSKAENIRKYLFAYGVDELPKDEISVDIISESER